MSHDPGIFSIGEFSQISGLSLKTLRFYDEKGLLKPAQVDPSTGYRFYDPAAADRARVAWSCRAFPTHGPDGTFPMHPRGRDTGPRAQGPDPATQGTIREPTRRRGVPKNGLPNA